MTTDWRVRSQPCTTCGGKIVIIETKLSGLGGLWRRTEPVRVQHADFEPGGGRVDHVDADCRRGRELGPNA